MLSSRLLITIITGLFSFVLGVFALYRNPRKRLNRSYAFHNFAMGAWNILTGPFTLIPDHTLALYLYRLVQIGLPLHCYFLIRFIQDYSGIYDKPHSKRVRNMVLFLLIIISPFYLTSYIIEDFSNKLVGNDLIFMREAGPLYLFNLGLFFVLFLYATITTFKNLWSAQGIRRNQMMFIALGIAMGLLSLVFYAASFAVIDLPWVYFSLPLGMLFCFAYAIFKYQLFEFDVWMGRMAINGGVYMVLISIPLFLYFPFRDWLVSLGDSFWTVLTAGTVAYAILFSRAPRLTSYLRQKAEEKKWAALREQLEFIKESSERMADETGLTISEISRRVVSVLKEFYWSRMRTPLKFVFSAIVDFEGEPSLAYSPELHIEKSVLKEFLQSLQDTPIQFLNNPFSEFDIDHKMDEISDEKKLRNLETIKKYMASNRIEICCPAIHDGKVRGALLLGPKEKGIFWQEELTVLNMLASHLATAVRKSELLSRNQELKELDRLKTDLISNITHEFKTPLHVVENAIEILLHDVQKCRLNRNKVGDYLLMIKNNTGLLSDFIQNLLEVTRIEQSKVDLQMEEADLKRVVDNAVELLRPLAGQKNLKLTAATASVSLKMDVDKMKQVFNNLINNAVKFTEKGQIEVHCQKNGTRAMVSVKDSGVGMKSGYLSAIFDKFFQIPDTAMINAEGTGLGLALAKGWVEAHRGRIWAESGGIGKGSTFFVDLPVSAAAPLNANKSGEAIE